MIPRSDYDKPLMTCLIALIAIGSWPVTVPLAGWELFKWAKKKNVKRGQGDA
jgi:hypothetical protein